MDENKLLYYDVYGRVNRIYASHNRSYGFEQPYEHFHAKYELNFVVSSIPTRVKTLGRIYNIDKPHIRLHKPFSFHIASVTRFTNTSVMSYISRRRTSNSRRGL